MSLLVGLLVAALATPAAAQSSDPDRSDWTPVSVESPALFIALPPEWTAVPGAAVVEATSPDDDWLSLGRRQGEGNSGSASERATAWSQELADALSVSPDIVEISVDGGTIVRLDATLSDAAGPVRSYYVYDACDDGGAVLAFRGADPAHRAVWDTIAMGVEPCVSAPSVPSTGEPESAQPLAFEPITGKGKGDKIVRFEIPEDAAAIADIKASGKGNFAIWSLDENGDKLDLLVNEIGAYKGTVLFDEQEGEHSVAFEVTASGSWTIRIEPVSEARIWRTGKALTGKGDDVVLISPPIAGLAATDVKHSGSSNFAVWVYSDEGTDLLVNDIGRYSGQVLLPDGAFLLAVSADGKWTMSAPE